MAGQADVKTVLDAIARALENIDDDTARVAAFDADGTLWAGDIGERAFVDGAALIDEAIFNAHVRPAAERWGVSLPSDVAGALAALQAATDSGQLAPVLGEVYQLNAWVFAGRTHDELSAFGAEIYQAHIAPGVFDHVAEVLEGLAALQVRPVIVSASHQSFARAGGTQLGFAEDDIFGMLPKAADDGRFGVEMERVTFGEGKHHCLMKELGAPALAGFGDSPAGNDRALLGGAKVAVAVGPTGADLDVAKANGMWILAV